MIEWTYWHSWIASFPAWGTSNEGTSQLACTCYEPIQERSPQDAVMDEYQSRLPQKNFWFEARSELCMRPEDCDNCCKSTQDRVATDARVSTNVGLCFCTPDSLQTLTPVEVEFYPFLQSCPRSSQVVPCRPRLLKVIATRQC